MIKTRSAGYNPHKVDDLWHSASKSTRLLVFNQQIDYKTGTMRLREFCGSQSCFVVLFHALGSICNGHPASKVIKNQDVTNSKKSIFNATAIS
jgi:hypothetical protein